jgi:oxygen-dependent protoporphyrinogen oxidase
MTETRTAAVVGAGIAGLSAAYDLHKAGFETTVFESRDRVGGRIWTVHKGDFLMDLGTAVYLGTYRDAIKLIHEVGLSDQFVERSAMGAMMRDGTIHRFDYTTPVRTALGTKALSWPAKLKAIKLAALTFKTRKSLGYDTYDELAALDTETVRDYCRRELNEELLQYCGRPLVSGTWVADDTDTSLALMLWTIRNMLVPNVYNLTNGVIGLPEELARRLQPRLGHAVSNVSDTGRAVEVTYDAGEGERTESFDACVIATTAEPALAMFPQMDANHRALYETTRYRRLGSFCIGLSKRPKAPETYALGALCEDPDTIAVICDHNKAPGRAPDGKGLLTVLLTHEYLERSEHLSDEEVMQYAIDTACTYHPDLSPSDVEETMGVRWAESVPTIDVGRFKRIAEFKKHLDPAARVQFASDLDRIPGLNGALVSGQEAAARVGSAVPAGRGIPAPAT